MGMKTAARRTNIIDTVLDEYVNWGGPIIQRRVVLADLRADGGYSDKAIDALVFGRTQVPAPADPAWNLEFHRAVQAKWG
jgi:hypothetical protein